MTNIRRTAAETEALRNGGALARSLKVGDRVACSVAFTSPIGAHFLAGDTFTVTLVGPVNICFAHDRTGSGVWAHVSDGTFYTDAWK